jgi:hypothetical protein
MGPTEPNRAFLYAATSFGVTSGVIAPRIMNSYRFIEEGPR